MTSPADNSLKTESPSPGTGSTNWPELSATEREDRVRALFAARHSSHPLYAARAAKDPDFWKTYSVGAPNLYPEEWLHMDKEEVARNYPV